MASTTSLNPWAAEQLAGIVGSGWQAGAAQAEALAGLLRRAMPSADLVALGEVWEAAGAALSRRSGPLSVAAADDLVAGWLRFAARRADEWRRPRDQRPKQGRASVHPTADLSRVVAQ
jgi:hypothetical protein